MSKPSNVCKRTNEIADLMNFARFSAERTYERVSEASKCRGECVCVCVCVCARARARMCVCVCVVLTGRARKRLPASERFVRMRLAAISIINSIRISTITRNSNIINSGKSAQPKGTKDT
jgi:hypothetical protein